MKKTTANATYDIQYHFVWIPKYRKRVLEGLIKERLNQLFHDCAEINQFEIMGLIKGGSSRVIRSEFPEIEEFLWSDSFWADGYFVSTHSTVTEDIIKEYIRNQGEDR